MGMDRLVTQGVSLHINFVSISQSRIRYQGREVRYQVVVRIHLRFVKSAKRDIRYCVAVKP